MTDKKLSELPEAPSEPQYAALSSTDMYIIRGGVSYRASVDEVIPHNPYHTEEATDVGPVTTTNAAWTTILSLPYGIDEWNVCFVNVSGWRLDSNGQFVGQYQYSAYSALNNPEVIQSVETQFQATTQTGVRFRVEENGPNLDLQVRGRNNQTWEFNLELFRRALL